MIRTALLIAVVVVMAVPAGVPEKAIQFNLADMPWAKGEPPLPPVEMVVLEGDPTGEGLYTIRVRSEAGAVVPPHFHERAERVTVISGSILVGFGDVVDRSNTTEFKAGAYYVNPAGVHHFLIMGDEGVVVQITGFAPWELKMVGKTATEAVGENE